MNQRYDFTYIIPYNSNPTPKVYRNVSKRRAIELKRMAMQFGYKYKIEHSKETEDKENGIS